MPFAQRWRDIRTGFERPFWVANISELFERLSYYAAFASLARYLHEVLHFPVEQTGTLTGFFGGLVWFLAVFGGTVADRMGFRRALSLAYLILSCSYFLLGSLGAPWLAPIRDNVPLVALVTFVLALPALGVALVKPSVVGTTARASKENVRSIGYSIYYTLVNIGGAAGPYVASFVHQHMRVENVFRVAALSVFLMFMAVLLFFREPRRTTKSRRPACRKPPEISGPSLTNPRFMLFLLIFTGYWIVYWQEFITLPIYVHDYVNPHDRHRTAAGDGAAGRHRADPGDQYPHPEDTRLQRHHCRHADHGAGMDHPDRARPPSTRRDLDADRGCARRNHAIAPLLRIHFAAGALGTAGDIHGLCVPAAGNRLADRRQLWRIPDPSLTAR